MKQISTFDKFMQDPKRKKIFDEEYENFLMKEFLLENPGIKDLFEKFKNKKEQQ